MSIDLPPLSVWPQTGWFRLLCALLAAGLLYLAYLWRIRQIAWRIQAQLKARQMERERIARALHDTLLQGVQSLTLRFQTAIDQLPPEAAAVRATMEHILDSADQIMVTGRDQVMDLRGSLEFGSDMAQSLNAAGSAMSGENGVRFQFTVEGAVRRMQPLVTDEMNCIGREALSNAFRHAHANRVVLTIAYGCADFRLQVQDDGQGIDEQTLSGGGRHRHWGLAGMRERAHNLGGRLDIWSRPGNGTEVVLTVPAPLVYADADQHPLRRWLDQTILRVMRRH
ncbi:MAG TPA: ATP-binding protein [Burkholderiaceae bacterium]|nr:ATP-binding protein [Burkholderiaceae bacterium]